MALWNQLDARERRSLGALMCASVGALAFVKLASEIVEGETRRLDERLLLLLREPHDRADPLGPRWLEEAARDVTALGSPTLLTLLTFIVVGFLLFERERRAALTAAVAAAGAGLLSTLLKLGYHRPRPDLVPHATYVESSSYPSGHAMVSTAVLLSLAAMLAGVTPRAPTRVYLFVVAALLALAIGLSRVYLGVHFPSDVLGGWIAGAAWALLWWVVGRRLQLRAPLDDRTLAFVD